MGELATKVGSGKTPTGGNTRYRTYGRPFVRSQNVGWGTLLLTDLQYIDEATHAEFPSSEIAPGDVLLNITGASIGRSAVANEALVGGNVNQHVCIIRPRSADSRLINHFLLSPVGQRQIESFQAGGNRQGLNFSQVGSIKIPLPPTEVEQRAIANAITNADILIASLEQLLTKKHQIKQGAVKELFSGRRRLPGFTEKWGEIAIGDFTDCTAGGTPSTRVEGFWGGDIPWMSSGELHKKRVWAVEGRITDDGLKNSSTKWIPERCVLIGLAGQGKTRGTVAMNMIRLCTNQSIAAIFPSEEYDSDFLFHNLDWRYDELRELSAGGGGRGGLNLTLIRSIVVPLPPRSEQRAIAALLSDMDTDIATIKARLTKARALKQAMAQALLTGRIRLVGPHT